MNNLPFKRIIPYQSKNYVKKSIPYDDTKIKLSKTFQTNDRRPRRFAKEKFEQVLTNLKEGLAEITSEFNINDIKDNNDLYHSINVRGYASKNRKNSLSISKNKALKSNTPKRDYSLIRKKVLYLDDSKSLNTNTKRKNDFINISERYIKSSRINPASQINSMAKNKTNLRRRFLTSNNIRYNISNDYNYYTINNSNNLKFGEISNLNNILNEQNRELRQTIRDMRFKINDLLNNNKLIRMDCQRLKDDKKKLLMRISNLENKLDINKNLSMNELELKSNTIVQLNQEIMKLNALLDEKENEIINLNNNQGNNNFYYDEANSMNSNKLLQRIKDLTNEIEQLKKERERININNRKLSSNLKNNDNKNFNLIQENKKIKNLYNNIKNENEKMKNYLSNVQSQKLIFDKKQVEYKNSLNNLSKQVNALKNENNLLKNSLNSSKNNINQKPQNKNNSNNEKNLKNQISQLLEENNRLKDNLNQKELDIENNSNNHFQELNFMKNNVEEKKKRNKEFK